MKVAIYTHGLTGHRESYLNFTKKTLEGDRVSKKEIFLTKKPVLFLSIEDNLFFYTLSSLYRSLLGRKTVGLLFRPKSTIDKNSLKIKIKRILLKFLKLIPNISSLLIVPTYVNEEFIKISDGYIYDFQFWDLTEKDYDDFIEKKKKPLIDKIEKKTICAIGAQNREKGFDIFLDTFILDNNIRNKFLFAYGGKSTVEFKDKINEFIVKKGFSIDRFITEEELISFYASADLIWSLYAEDYDQASGVFGRAIQLGIPVIVRKNSLIHKISEKENILHIAIESHNVNTLSLIKIEEIDINRGKILQKNFKKKSLFQLNNSLGLENE